MKLSPASRLRLLYFLVFCCTAAWLPIFADFLKDQGLTGVRISIILSITPLLMFLVQPYVGMAADRYGYKKVLLWSSGLAGLSYLGYLIGGGFLYFSVVTVIMAVFYNTLQPILDGLALQLSQSDHRFSYGTLRIAGAAGWAFMGIVVGHYIHEINTAVIFVFSALSMLLTWLLSWSLPASESLKAEFAAQITFRGFKHLMANKALWFILVIAFLVSAGATTIWNFYSLYLHELGAASPLVGLGLSIQGLAELPLFYFSAWIIGQLGLRITLVITILATALRMALYAVIKNPEVIIFVELLHGISWSLFWVVCVEYVSHLVQPEWRVTGQSLLYASFLGVGAIVGNLWTGWLYDLKVLLADIFMLNAGFVFFVFVLALFLPIKILKPEVDLPNDSTR